MQENFYRKIELLNYIFKFVHKSHI